MPTDAMQYLSCADTAKLVRKTLKAAFPAVKFSIRSSVYSGGASIDVHWTDGPRCGRVERTVKVLEGATFDGMRDLKEYHDTILVGPDGPRVVHLGADFIFCKRTVTDEQQLAEEAAAMIRAQCVTDGAPPNDMFGNEWVTNLARGMAYALDFEKGTTLEQTFREVVLRERDE